MSDQQTTWKNRIIGESMEAPDQLLANPFNWRIHSNLQKDALKGVLKEVGWVQRVIKNKTTGHIVDGHARVIIAMEEDEPEVPVLLVELTEDEEKKILAVLDPIGGMAGMDAQALHDLLQDVESEEKALATLLENLESDAAAELGIDDPELPPSGDAETNDPSEDWGIIVELNSEQEQVELLTRLMEEGYTCKALM